MTLVYVVHNPKNQTTYVFSNHKDALKCREDQHLNHWHLWGCTIDCYIPPEKLKDS